MKLSFVLIAFAAVLSFSAAAAASDGGSVELEGGGLKYLQAAARTEKIFFDKPLFLMIYTDGRCGMKFRFFLGCAISD